MDVRGRYELGNLDDGVHPTAPLVNHIWEHGFPVLVPGGMIGRQLKEVLWYGCHGQPTKRVYL